MMMDLGAGTDLQEYLQSLSNPPFVSLKYVEGLHYTFGTKFVGRWSQGEFINFTLNHDDVEEVNYFVLRCREGHLWISSCDDVSVK